MERFMASSLPPVVRHLPSDEEIRDLLADQIDVQHKRVGMVVGIIAPEGRRVVSLGSTSRHGGHAVGGDTAFEIASVTKVFTSLVLVEMVERPSLRVTVADRPRTNRPFRPTCRFSGSRINADTRPLVRGTANGIGRSSLPTRRADARDVESDPLIRSDRRDDVIVTTTRSTAGSAASRVSVGTVSGSLNG
jgi:hypothetical protein